MTITIQLITHKNHYGRKFKPLGNEHLDFQTRMITNQKSCFVFHNENKKITRVLRIEENDEMQK